MTDNMPPRPGQAAPDLSLRLVGGGDWRLADQSPEAFTIVVFYRGLHCPICKAYLKDLLSLYDDYRTKGIDIVAVSMDGEDRATQARGDWGLDPMPVGYGMTLEQARTWGLYLSDRRNDPEPEVFSEPGLAVVKPDGSLYMMEIASGPFIRPDMKLLLSKMDFVIEKDYPPRGRHAA